MSKIRKRQMFFAQSEQGFDRTEQSKPETPQDIPISPRKEPEAETPDGPLPWEQEDR